MSRKGVGDENVKWIMLVLANLEMGSNSPTTSACLKSQVFLGRRGKRAMWMNLRTHTIRFVNLGAQVECLCVCVCAFLTEESSIIHFVFFKRPQLMDVGDGVMALF